MLKYLIIASLLGSVLTAFATSLRQDEAKDVSPERARSQLVADYRRDSALTLKRLDPTIRQCLTEQAVSDYSPEYRQALHRVLVTVLETGLRDGSDEEKRTFLTNWIRNNVGDLVTNLSASEKDAFGGEIKRLSGQDLARCVVKTYALAS